MTKRGAISADSARA